MMKKILFIFALFLLISAFAPKKTLAQQWDNQFDCTYEIGYGCVPKTQIFPHGCAPGFDVNREVCESITDSSICNGTVNQGCISVTPPGTRYSCLVSFGGCVPDDNGPYTDFDTCNAACHGTTEKFRCDLSRGCILDPDGPYNYAECENTCRPSSIEPMRCSTTDGKDGIDTAIGCIPIESPSDLIGFILKWAIGIGGGIAFLLILFAGFQIMTSSGNPDRLKAGQELMTSAIAGLILLIFSVFILEIIGVGILNLSGFGGQ